MSVVLVIYFIFLFLYVAFNIYAILRILSMRIKGDKTKEVAVIYMAIISFLILISLIMISGLDWSIK